MDWEFPFYVAMWMLCAILGGVIVNAIMVFVDAIRDRLYWWRLDREQERRRKQGR